MSQSKTYRPLDPKTGLVILGGSLVASGIVTVLLAWLVAWPQEWLARLGVTTSSGAWLMVDSLVFFPVVFAYAFLRLARGVAPMRLAFAYAGTLYFLQCASESAARGDIALWWELAATVVATIVFYKLAQRCCAEPGEDESGGTPG